MFVCLSGISALFVSYLSNSSFVGIDFIEIIEIILRGFLTCLIISNLQIYFLIITTEANTFFLLIILTIVLSFSSHNIYIFSILPKPLRGIDLFLNLLVCIALLVLFSIYTKTAFIKKELY